MSAITKVTLAGATGDLGHVVLEHLLGAGFQVNVLTRKDGTYDFPASVTAKPVDYDSVESLTAALQGQDAVVSTVGFPYVRSQFPLIEASVKAGVKRFIPSEFGSDTTNPKVASWAVFANKVAVRQTLTKAAADGNISYSIVFAGPFLDWGLEHDLYLNSKEKSIPLWDGGERYFSVTTLKNVGKAVAGVLKHPEETKNRAVYIQDTTLNLKKLKALVEKATGFAWEGKVLSIEDEVLGPVAAELKKENPDISRFIIPVVLASVWTEGCGGLWENLDNDLLGLRDFTEAEVEAAVAGSMARVVKYGAISH